MSGSRPAELLARLGLPGDEADIREIAPTLEDVFVTLTRDAEAPRARKLPRTASSGRRAVARRRRPKRPAEASIAETSIRLGPRQRNPQRSPWPACSAVMVKEFSHIRRQPSTLFFMLVVPVMQTIIFGYAIDTQIEHIPMVVFDLDGRRHASGSSRPLSTRGGSMSSTASTTKSRSAAR